MCNPLTFSHTRSEGASDISCEVQLNVLHQCPPQPPVRVYPSHSSHFHSHLEDRSCGGPPCLCEGPICLSKINYTWRIFLCFSQHYPLTPSDCFCLNSMTLMKLIRVLNIVPVEWVWGKELHQNFCRFP